MYLRATWAGEGERSECGREIPGPIIKRFVALVVVGYLHGDVESFQAAGEGN